MRKETLSNPKEENPLHDQEELPDQPERLRDSAGDSEDQKSLQKIDKDSLNPQIETFSNDTSYSQRNEGPSSPETILPARNIGLSVTFLKKPTKVFFESVNTGAGDPKSPLNETIELEEQKCSGRMSENKEIKEENPHEDENMFQRPALERRTLNNLVSSLKIDPIEYDDPKEADIERPQSEETPTNKKYKPYFIKNGFTNCPPSVFQISSYFCVAFIVIVFTKIIIRTLPVGLAVFLGLVYYLELFILTFLALWATWKDPTVKESILQINARANKEPQIDTSDFDFFCNWCEVSVTDKVKHCRTCSRDVYRFDHHCWWVNNCIGEPNYHIFIGLIITCSIYLFTTSLISLGFIIKQAISRESSTLHFYLVVASFAISFVFWVLVTKLTIFHFYLSKRKMTTYEFLLERRKKKNVHSSQVDKIDKLSFPDHRDLNDPEHIKNLSSALEHLKGSKKFHSTVSLNEAEK